jgi:hypothetical protein
MRLRLLLATVTSLLVLALLASGVMIWWTRTVVTAADSRSSTAEIFFRFRVLCIRVVDCRVYVRPPFGQSDIQRHKCISENLRNAVFSPLTSR